MQSTAAKVVVQSLSVASPRLCQSGEQGACSSMQFRWELRDTYPRHIDLDDSITYFIPSWPAEVSSFICSS